ncbi:MAG: LysR family transcriptional regulator [Rhodobacteraceae bacterium]|nr:LysR family transcriptional regulator [Paracoccaceae bacterium]
MVEQTDTADWSLIRSFLAVADTGSLSAAAAELGQSQPTLGRRIRQLEQSLGTELFHRHARGLHLTASGAALRPMAETMRAAMNDIAVSVAGQARRLEGTVRITASVFAAHYLLPPILARIRAAEPAISLILQPSDSSENLLFREADIAVRMYRPDQLDVVTRHVRDLPLGIYAARSYLDRRGVPQSPQDLMRHDLVGFDNNDLVVRSMREMGYEIRPEDFAVRCDNQATYWALIRAGCGIGFSQRSVGMTDPDIVDLTMGLAMPALPVWLAAHERMRDTPRLRRVWDLLGEGLQALPG